MTCNFPHENCCNVYLMAVKYCKLVSKFLGEQLWFCVALGETGGAAGPIP